MSKDDMMTESRMARKRMMSFTNSPLSEMAMSNISNIYSLIYFNCLNIYYLNTSLAAKGALAHRLQRRTACNAAPLQRCTAAPPAEPKMAAMGP